MFKQIFKSIKGRGFRSILIILAVLLIIVPVIVKQPAMCRYYSNRRLEPVNPNAVNESFSEMFKLNSYQRQQNFQKHKIQVPLISVDSDYQETVNTTYSIKPTKVSNEGFNTSNGTFLIDSIAPAPLKQCLLITK